MASAVCVTGNASSRTTSRLLRWALAPAFLAWTGLVHAAPLFGVHLPHGNDAVAYLYGPQGTWREQTNVYYGWNFYKHCETPSHVHDPRAMLLESSASNSTAPDANCILLGDLDNDGEISDDSPGGFAFHEHAGRGLLGEQTAAPFYQFWFDDNWVARYMAETYGRSHPIGLHDFGHAIRWRLLGGDNNQWVPYPPSTFVDQIAFNGLFKLNAGDFDGALDDWLKIRDSSGAVYDAARRRFDYSFAAEAIYYYGLWAIFSERLLAARTDFSARDEVLQHAMSLHSWLLTLQEKDRDGHRLGWRTGTVAQALINTETTSVAVLALGAHASWVLEPGYEPLWSAAGHYANDNNVLSAVAGQSVAGHMVYGPYLTLAPGTYDVEFALRTRAARIDSPLATLDVYDGRQIVAALTVDGALAPTGDQWRRYKVTAQIANAVNLTEFRVYWHGANDLDVGPIRVVAADPSTAAAFVTGAATRVSTDEPDGEPAVIEPGTQKTAVGSALEACVRDVVPTRRRIVAAGSAAVAAAAREIERLLSD